MNCLLFLPLKMKRHLIDETQLRKGVIIYFLTEKIYLITKTQSHEKNEFEFFRAKGKNGFTAIFTYWSFYV